MAVDQWREELRRTTHSFEQTQEIGRWLSDSLETGQTVALIGSLGTGKTTFVRGLAQALGYSGRVRSPSFTLVNQYESTPELIHVDLYRLSHIGELIALGLEEEREGRLMAVEWADRFDGQWGEMDWRVTFKIPEDGDPESDREIIVERRVGG
jgi:tRNA threonylcarbamoyladenosine biosynthesis protein TsaE